MADSSAYLPDKIKKQIGLVSKLRRLPLPGEVLVNKGDIVGPDTPVAKIALRPGIPWVIPASRLLGIETNQLSKTMLKKVGESVKTKEVFARAEQGLYGRKELESPTDGIIGSLGQSNDTRRIRQRRTSDFF